MTDNEKAICAVNAAARAKGMSYGLFIVRSTKEELEELTGRGRTTEKKRKRQKKKQERTGRPANYEAVSMSKEYLAKVAANRRARILREGKLEAEAAAIREWRKARGLTQKQLGEMVGLSASAVFGWEKGINGAPWEELEKLGCGRPYSPESGAAPQAELLEHSGETSASKRNH